MRTVKFTRITLIGSSLTLLFLIIASISVVGLIRLSRDYTVLYEKKLIMREVSHAVIDLLAIKTMIETDSHPSLEIERYRLYQEELDRHFATLNEFFNNHHLSNPAEHPEYLLNLQAGEIHGDLVYPHEPLSLDWSTDSPSMVTRVTSLIDILTAVEEAEDHHLQIMKSQVDTSRWRTLTVTIVCAFLSLGTLCLIIILLMRELTGHRKTTTELNRISRTLQVTSQINALLISIDSSTELFNSACRMLVDVGGYRFAWIGVAMHDTERSVCPIAQEGFASGYLDDLKISWGDNRHGQGPTGIAIRTGNPAVSHMISDDPGFALRRTEAVKRDYRSSAALPIFSADGTCLGSLNVYSREERAFAREELDLLTELTDSLNHGLQVIHERQEKGDLQIELSLKAQDLGERVKELNFLHRISEMIDEQDLTLADLLQNILNIIPPAWLHPGRTSARLKCCLDGNELEFETEDFQPSRWRLSSDFNVDDEVTGVVEVFYTDRNSGIETNPFLPEEQELLHSIARKIQRHFKFLKAANLKEEAERALTLHRAKLMAADRLRSLGEISTSIAHELNQPLLGVRGLAEYLLLQHQDSRKLSPEEYSDILTKIIEQSDRMDFIIKHVRDFARGADQLEGAPVDINEVVQSSLFLFRTQLASHGIALECDLPAKIPLTLANPYALEEVIINLLNNALFAVRKEIKEAGLQKPTIWLRTSSSTVDSTDFVNLEISDNGPGIPESSLATVFEPFFTTKAPGEGTGLGLPISQAIIKQYHGSLEIQNRETGGARVRLSLPVFKETHTMEASG
jgi:C4-dicarboxylate-specific signal transduction histidine kinase